MKGSTLLLILLLLAIFPLRAQQVVNKADSTARAVAELPAKYFNTITAKSQQYYKQVDAKTEKTLERLARWEAKIKNILEKASPETAQRLFAEGQISFAILLERYRAVQAKTRTAIGNTTAVYNEYRDKLTTTLKYVDQQKQQLQTGVVEPMQKAKAATDKLNEHLSNSEALQQLIKERKKQLLEQAIKYLGKSKYLGKISKESYYYIEALKNYKELFSDPKKTEELALKLLQKIPGFGDFLRRNSMLASLFGSPDASGSPASLAGLQTRAQVNNLIQQQLAAGGPNAQQQFQRNMQAAQAELSELKNKLLKAGQSGGGADDLPPPGKLNNQRSKTFLQRLEYGATIQSQKGNSFWPNSSDIGLTLGYRAHDKATFGVGISYRLGLGRGLNAIRFTSEGLGLRSYIDWKLKGSFWISGGYEQNYRTAFNSVEQLRNQSAWQQSGLIGISKKISLKTKFLKQTSVRLYWDFLSYQVVPRGQPVVLRVGYNF